LLTVGRADVGRPSELVAHLLLHYADLPLAYTYGNRVSGVLVRDRFTADLSLSYSLFERLQLSLSLPVTLHQGGDVLAYPDVATGQSHPLPRVVASGMEDLRLALKGRLWSNEHFGLGGAAEVVAPTGNAEGFLGSSRPSGTVQLLAHATWRRATVALNLGWHQAARQQLLNIQTGSGQRYGAGVEVEVYRHADVPFHLLGEVYGLVHPSFASASSSPAEAMFAGKAQVRDWSFFLGAGAGLNAGYGEPRVRVVAGLAYTWQYRPKPSPPQPPSPPPPAPPPAITLPVAGDRLQLQQQVYFEFNKDTIKPESFPLLDEVARFLREHQELGRIRIEGHTDDVGTESYNLELSQRRARAVFEYLSKQGVLAERLGHMGYGKRCPLSPNDTEEGRSINRRVDFVIVSRERTSPVPGKCPERTSVSNR
jgi:outer membrane protein OmpA-like peptidoglycan-associated protein